MNNPPRQNRPEACIHIGLPKAASTTLQEHLFARHPELEFLNESGSNLYRPTMMREIIVNLAQPQSDRTLDEWKQSVEEVSWAGSIAERTVVASREGLCVGGHKNQEQLARNIKHVFGPSRIIFIARHPVYLLESQYFQKLRQRNVRKARDREWRRRTGYFTIDDWLSQEWSKVGGLSSLLLSHQIIEAHVSVFGRANVGVFLFEQLQQDSAAFMTGICDFMGIDPVEGVRLASAEHAKLRMAASSVERLKDVHRSPWRRFRFRRSSSKERSRMLGIGQFEAPAEEQRASVDLPTVWKDRIEDFSREGCQYLEREWGLRVDEFDYPL